MAANTINAAALNALQLADWIDSDFDPDEMSDVGYDAITKELRSLHAKVKALEDEYKMPSIEDASQDWAKCDPAIAFHLIERHSNSWADAGKMMAEFAAAKAGAEVAELRAKLAEAKAVLALVASSTPASTAQRLTDEQIDAIAEAMPGGTAGMLKQWGYQQFARKILELRAMPTWEPQFDVMAPGQEELVMQFCQEIAGERGQKGRLPDPVRLLEMAEALYQAERRGASCIVSTAPPAGGGDPA
ncbi:MAG: hypothetical protein ACN6O3_12485 [Comamonas sp.]